MKYYFASHSFSGGNGNGFFSISDPGIFVLRTVEKHVLKLTQEKLPSIKSVCIDFYKEISKEEYEANCTTEINQEIQ